MDNLTRLSLAVGGAMWVGFGIWLEQAPHTPEGPAILFAGAALMLTAALAPWKDGR